MHEQNKSTLGIIFGKKICIPTVFRTNLTQVLDRGVSCTSSSNSCWGNCCWGSSCWGSSSRRSSRSCSSFAALLSLHITLESTSEVFLPPTCSTAVEPNLPHIGGESVPRPAITPTTAKREDCTILSQNMIHNHRDDSIYYINKNVAV